jgi:hypothetical protein
VAAFILVAGRPGIPEATPLLQSHRAVYTMSLATSPTHS